MHSLRIGFIMLVTLCFLGISATSWADRKFKTKDFDQGWDDRYDRGHGDYPPGWDKGKKTGWRGRNLPPGQAKKYDDRYYRGYDPYDDRYRYDPRREPEYIPIPVPVPVPVR